MHRMTSHAYAPAIQHAYDLIPRGLHQRLACDFLVGVDPVFVGLHRFEAATYGRSYRDTPHCAYPEHQDIVPKSRRVPTVILPTVQDPAVVVHELGHILHWNLDLEPQAKPTTRYAETNWMEAFAEAFTAWVIPGYADDRDPQTFALLDSLTVSTF